MERFLSAWTPQSLVIRMLPSSWYREGILYFISCFQNQKEGKSALFCICCFSSVVTFKKINISEENILKWHALNPYNLKLFFFFASHLH